MAARAIRIAAEAEAEAEAKAARIAPEAEAARIAAEVEAARIRMIYGIRVLLLERSTLNTLLDARLFSRV